MNLIEALNAQNKVASNTVYPGETPLSLDDEIIEDLLIIERNGDS